MSIRPDHVRAALRTSSLTVMTVVSMTFICSVTLGAQVAPRASNPEPADLRELSLEELGAVQITSVSKQPRDLWTVPAALSVITRADIRRSGATSLPELLRLAPGVEVARADASHWSIGIRGFGEQFSKSLLVLIDGRNIYSPLFAGTYWPAYDTPLEDIERIEVIRGPGATVWGGNAVNGVINIVTRRANDTRGLLVSLGTGSDDWGTALVRYGGGNGRNVNYRLYAKAFLHGPQYHDDGSNFDSEWWMGDTGFRLDWDRQNGGTFTVQAGFSDGRHGQRVQVSSFTPPSLNVLDGLVDTSGGYLRARWEPTWGGHNVRLQASYDRLVWQAPHFEEVRDTIDLDYVQRSPVWLRQQLTWGAGTRWSPATFTQVVSTLDFSPRAQTDRLYSAFLQDEIQLLPSVLALTVGSKFEHNSYSGPEWLPSARLAWTPRPAHTVWSAVTRAVRTPSRIEQGIRLTTLASTAGPVFFEVMGSPDFDAEEVVSYEAGYRVRVTPALSIDTTGYHSEHDNLAGYGLGSISIEMTPSPPHGLARLPFINGLLGRSHGFEVAPDWRPFPWWRLSGSYAFRRIALHSKPDNIDPNAVPRLEGSSPAHLGRVQSAWTLPYGWELDAVYRQTGELSALGIDGYHTADARAAWRVSPSVELSIAGQNLLQRHHPELPHTTGNPVEIERSVYARVAWTLAGGR